MANINAINNATYTLTSDTAITATTGNITATAGNLVSTLGDLVLTNGKITLAADSGTDGYVICAATGANPTWSAITAAAGSGITVTLGANTIALASTAPFTWAQVGADGALVVNQGSINTKVALLTMSLPATAAVGTTIILQGLGAGGWTITQAANQQVILGNQTTTLGAGGSLASTNANDSISLVCTTADLIWSTYAVIGNITIV